jgi:hypothetical protein
MYVMRTVFIYKEVQLKSKLQHLINHSMTTLPTVLLPISILSPHLFHSAFISARKKLVQI